MTPTPTASPVTQDVAKDLGEQFTGEFTNAQEKLYQDSFKKAKYFRNGLRTFYQVKGDHVMQIINKLTHSYVTVSDRGFLLESALEGQEISREQFAEQFAIAAKLIALDPV